MLEFLRYRRCPEGTPPHEEICSFIPALISSRIATILYSQGFSFPLRHLYVFQAQLAASSAYCAVIQK